ncbi:MAG: BUG/TctC family periplasmic protein, partial [uncultured Rubellimicrobium sp.]
GIEDEPAVGLGAGHGLGAAGGGAGAGLPRAHGDDGGALRGRGLHGRGGAHRGRGDGGGAGPAGDRGERHRRRRQHRCRPGRARGGRRLHDPDGDRGDPRAEPAGAARRGLRPAGRLRADLAPRARAQRAGGEPRAWGGVGGGARGAAEGRAGRAFLRLVGQRHAASSVGGAVQLPRRGGDGARALPGLGAGARGSAWQSGVDHVRQPALLGAVHPGGHAAGAGGDDAGARGVLPRRAHHRRDGAGLRDLHLERALRACGHSARGDREVGRGGRRGDGQPGGGRAAGGVLGHRGGVLARGAVDPCGGRDRAVDADRGGGGAARGV